MKKTNIIFILLLSAFLISLLTILSIHIWLTNFSWRGIATVEEMEYNGNELLNTPDLPEKFLDIYETLYPKRRHYSMYQQVIKSSGSSIFGGDCKCDDIGYIAWNNDNLNLKFNFDKLLPNNGYWKFGFALEKYASPEKCYDYWLNYDIPWNGEYLEDLNSLSVMVNGKEITELNSEEIFNLIAWRELLGNGVSDPEIVEYRVEVLKIEYAKQLNKKNSRR